LKKFVLDTNVILSDPNCIYKFEENDIYIPLIVIEELDRHKKGQEEKARNARHFSREVDKLRQKSDIRAGVELHTGGKLFIVVAEKTEVPLGMSLDTNDDIIILTAKQLGAILVSKDLNVRLKADAIGVESQDYKAGKIQINKDAASGYREICLTSEQLDSFRKNKSLKYSEANFANEYFIMTEEGNTRNSALGRFNRVEQSIVPLIDSRSGVFGVYPKNAEQRFAIDALLNDDIKLVSLMGKAGTGKTLIAIACGLEKIVNESYYSRMLVSRPVIPMGKDIGYLPGDVNEKLRPWMAPIFDNMDFIYSSSKSKTGWQELIDEDMLKIEALTYIRGRSIPGQYLIIDEAQNLSPHEIKTIITRVGEGTKIVLTGDCKQIDSPYLDEINNGLAYAIDRMKSEDIVAHVELTKGERSQLAEAATKLL
jgi:PhoH-like ATPase